MTDILFVEFVTPGRYFGGWAFPFAQGLLRQHGVRTRWLRFGVPADARRDEGGVVLGERGLATLRNAAVRPGLGGILFSAPPAPSLVQLLRNTRSELALALVAQGGAESAGGGEAVEALTPTDAALLTWAGQTPETGEEALDLLAVPTLDWSHELANAAAREVRPFVLLLGGRSCTYRAPLATSRFFGERLDAPGADTALPNSWGCSFCTVPLVDAEAHSGHSRRGLPPSDELIRRQLASIAATHPPVEGPLRYRVDGSNVVARPGRLAAAVEELDLPRGHFLIDLRADVLVDRAEELLDAARRVAARGHRLDLCLLGVETFSGPQLDRYHKGYEPELNLRAVRALRELEAACPDGFAFREHGGLSTVMFDPWATFGDIALNLAIAGRFRLEKLCGKLLTSRLRLVDGLPLTTAARADGLLADDHADPLLDTARRNLYGDELPWRFSDPRLLPLNQLLTRLDPDDTLADDALYRALQSWGEETGQDTIGRAERLLAEAVAEPETLTPEELLERARTPRRDGPREDDSAQNGGREDPERFRQGFDELLDVAAFAAGLKPVLKLEEPFSTRYLEQIDALLSERWPDLTVRRRQRRWGGGTVQEVFAGPDADTVDEAVALTDRRESETDPVARDAAVARTGELLGYPRCCADAFAAAGPFFQENNEWLIVRRRLETPGRVDPRLHPVRTGYVPCSLTCEKTAEFVSAVEAYTESAQQSDAARARLGELPTILFLERPGDFVALRPLEPVSERFRYEVAATRTDDPRAAALAEGDTLVVEPGLLRVLSDGQERACFALDAFLWWHGGVFHEPFWRECLREVTDPIPDPDETDDPEESAAPDDPEARRRLALKGHVAQLLKLLQGHPKKLLRGYSPTAVDVRATGSGFGEIVIELTQGEERLRFYVVPRGAADHAFHSSEHFALTHDNATHVDTPAKERLVLTLVAALERYLPQRMAQTEHTENG